MAGLDCRRNGGTHADTHDTPGANVEPFARLVHVDDRAREIQRIGTLVHQDRIGALLDDGLQHAQRTMKIHRRIVVHQLRRHLGDIGLDLGPDRARPFRRRGLPVGAHALEQRRDTTANIADQRGRDLDIAVHLSRLDVDLDEFLRLGSPLLAFAVRQKPVKAGADHHHYIGFFQHQRTRRASGLRVIVRKQAFGHAHRQIRNAALLDQSADFGIGLRVCSPFAEDNQRALGTFQHIERTRDRIRSGDLTRRRIDNLDERLGAGLGIHNLPEQFCGQIKIDAARTAGHSRANGARHSNTDVFRMQDAIGRLAQGLGDGQLVHLLIVALLKIDNFTLGRARDQDHRPAIGGGMRQRGQAVEETGGRHRQADTGLLRQVARNGRCIARILLMAERDDAHPFGLRHSAEVRDRDARHTIDRVDVVELECVDDKMKAVRQRLRRVGFNCNCILALPGLRAVRDARCHSHMLSPSDSRVFRSGLGRRNRPGDEFPAPADVVMEPERVLAHQLAGKLGVAVLDRLDDVHVIDHRPVGP